MLSTLPASPLSSPILPITLFITTVLRCLKELLRVPPVLSKPLICFSISSVSWRWSFSPSLLAWVAFRFNLAGLPFDCSSTCKLLSLARFVILNLALILGLFWSFLSGDYIETPSKHFFDDNFLAIPLGLRFRLGLDFPDLLDPIVLLSPFCCIIVSCLTIDNF
jgi:hypothetical protein